MKIRGIATDFFDVWCMDTQRAWLEQHGHKREGAFAEASDQLDEGRITYEEYLRRYAKASSKTPGEIHTFLAQTIIDPQMTELYRRLRHDYPVALASNAPSESVRPRLAAHGLNDILDIVVISGEVGVRKPSAEFFDLVVGGLKLEPREVLFIDDNVANCEGAEAVGLRAVHFTGHDALRRSMGEMGVL